MKRSVRPFLSILILIVIGISLSCRIAVRRGSDTLGPENIVLVETPARPVFNSTLLEFAAIDLGEASLTRETTQLLDGDFGPKRRFRSISSWHRSRQDINPTTFRGNRAFNIRSPNFYRLWLESKSVLENWSRNRRYQPDIMTELVRLVKLRIDRRIPSAGSSQRYSSCAVVGNSGILLKSHHGGLIDSHEVVIRLNNAKIENYEGHVGSKTNISFVNSNLLHLCARREGCFCQPYGMNVPMVMYICQAAHFLDYTICNSPRKVPLLITDPRFDVLCARIVKYYSVKRFVEVMGKPLEQWSSAHEGSMFHYSSGMQAVMLALGICDKVSIFGFGKSELAKHHYHTSQMGELHLHDYEAEYAFYHDLIERPQFHNVPRMDKGAKTVKECVGNFTSIPALPKAVWDQCCRN